MTDTHSCSYFCDRPACIKAQRDELRDALAQKAEPVAQHKELVNVLRGGRQCDEDGVEIIMSREACWEAAAIIESIAPPAPAALTDERIKDALLQYCCQYFQDDDGGLPLVDALAHAFGDTDISRAKHEIEMIVDSIAAAGENP